MKQDGKLGRNYLKGMLGDQIQAILCAVDHNLRLILNHPWCFCAQILNVIIRSVLNRLKFTPMIKLFLRCF